MNTVIMMRKRLPLRPSPDTVSSSCFPSFPRDEVSLRSNVCLPLTRSAGEGAPAGAGEGVVPTGEAANILAARNNGRRTPSPGPAGALLPPERVKGRQTFERRETSSLGNDGKYDEEMACQGEADNNRRSRLLTGPPFTTSAYAIILNRPILLPEFLLHCVTSIRRCTEMTLSGCPVFPPPILRTSGNRI
jgi:hypothetical protein